MISQSPNAREVSAFFKAANLDQIHLTAITPDGGTTARDFGTNIEAATEWACRHNQAGQNIHWTVNRVRGDVNRKPSKADITAIRFAHVDVDPPKGSQRWDSEAAYNALIKAPCPPSIVVASGNGLQGLWRVTCTESIDDAERINLALVHCFAGDLGTQNADRLLRVPGTINWPNKRKREQGRVPAMARLLQAGDNSYTVAKLVQTYPAPSSEKSSPANSVPATRQSLSIAASGNDLTADKLGLALDSRLRAMIDDPRNMDRSSDTYAFVCEALRQGLTPEQIVGVLLNPENRISEHCLSQPDPGRAVQRVLTSALAEEDVARRIRQREEDRRIGTLGDQASIPTARIYDLEDMERSKVFIADGSQVADLDRPKSVLSLTDFRNATAASTINITVNGQTREVKVAQLWLKSERRKNTDTLTFRPGHGLFTRDPNDRSALNMWRPLQYGKAPVDWEERVEPFTTHIHWLFSNDANAFLDWLAHGMQQPGVLPSYGWLHIAREQGLGRNWIASILARLWPGMTALGFDLVGALSTSFNGELGGKILAVVDEVDEGGGGKAFQHAQALKKIVTEETRLINPKYGRQRVEFNVCRWLIFSNSSTALPLEDKDRRFWICRCDDTAKSPAYYKRLYELREDPLFISSIAHWLQHRDITNFNPGMRPPMNDAKRALLERTRSDAEQILHDVARYWPSDLISSEELNSLMDEDRPRGRALAYALERAGITKVGEYKSYSTIGSRSRVTVYAMQNVDIWANAGIDAMRKELKQLSFTDKEAALLSKNSTKD